jgi:DNA-binding CsgD family transcriptional regulator
LTPSPDAPKLTVTQAKIMTVLADGLPHTMRELHGCLWDEEGSPKNVKMHLSRIRKVLRPGGRDILVQYLSNRLHYRLVLLISGPSADANP